MSQMYFILTVVGWAWLVVCLVIVPLRLNTLKRRREARGFEVTNAGGSNPDAERRA